MKLKLKDIVTVTIGKDKGKTAEITKILPTKQKVVVKGANKYKRHVKSREGMEGGVVEIERPLSVAKVALVCPSCKKLTRIGFIIDKSGAKTRICKKCQAPLDQATPTKKKTK